MSFEGALFLALRSAGDTMSQIKDMIAGLR